MMKKLPSNIYWHLFWITQTDSPAQERFDFSESKVDFDNDDFSKYIPDDNFDNDTEIIITLPNVKCWFFDEYYVQGTWDFRFQYNEEEGGFEEIEDYCELEFIQEKEGEKQPYSSKAEEAIHQKIIKKYGQEFFNKYRGPIFVGY